MASKAVLQNTSYNDLYRNICLFSVPLLCRVASLAHRQGACTECRTKIVPTATAMMAENVSEVSKTIWPLATEVGIEKTLPFPKQLYPINIKANSVRTVRGGGAAAAAAKETTRNSFNNIQMCPSSPLSALTTYNQYHAYIQCNTHLIFR